MSLALLLPAALAALAALLLPLLIHLVRRPQQRLVDFAALRWLAAASRPQRRVVLEERALLAVRLLLLALLALLLAQPVLQRGAAGGAWTVFAPGVDPGRVRADTGPGDDTSKWRWLAPGFPAITAAGPATADTASLLRELDARLPSDAALTVYVPEVVDGLDGERLALGRSVDWRVVPGATTGAPQAGFDPPALALRHPGERAASRRYLAAAVAAWQLDAPDTPALDARDDQSLPGATVDTLVWLHPGVLPQPVRRWVEAGRTVVVEGGHSDSDAIGVPVWRDGAGEPLAHARRVGGGRLVTLDVGMDPRTLPVLLDPDFPHQLRELLRPRAAPASAPAAAHAPLRATDAGGGNGPGLDQTRQALFPWLAVLLALLVLVERVMATRARRWQR